MRSMWNEDGEGGERSEDDEALTRLAEDVDEAMSPVVEEAWAPVFETLREQLRCQQAGETGPTPEAIVERMRADGLLDPEG